MTTDKKVAFYTLGCKLNFSENLLSKNNDDKAITLLFDDVHYADIAEVLDEVSFDEAIQKDLKVMDATALTLCRDQQLPIAVFNIFKSGALKNILLGQNEGTLVMPNIH